MIPSNIRIEILPIRALLGSKGLIRPEIIISFFFIILSVNIPFMEGVDKSRYIYVLIKLVCTSDRVYLDAHTSDRVWASKCRIHSSSGNKTP